MLFVVILLQAFQLKAPIPTVDTNINHIQTIIMYRCIMVVDWMFYVPVAVFNDLTMTSGKSHTYPLCSTVSSLSYRLESDPLQIYVLNVENLPGEPSRLISSMSNSTSCWTFIFNMMILKLEYTLN